MTLTIEHLNAATPTEFIGLLAGVYEHSPWIAERAEPRRPFRGLAQLKMPWFKRSARPIGPPSWA